MDKLVAVTVIGNDRPGIVAGVAETLYRLGCNLQDATSTILRGHFSMVLIVAAPDEVGAADIEGSLEGPARDLGLVVTARPVEEVGPPASPPSHMISVYGSDRPGIVFRVARLLADAGVNITDLNSRVLGAESEPVYALMLEASVPSGVDLEEPLRSLGEELGIEVGIHAIETDLL